MKILIMGLPGSGKTYLAERMQPILNAAWYNADKVREMANDWDFSPQGRVRQSLRMKNLADYEKNHGRIVICDFVCPTNETKTNFNPDITIWMDTIKSGRYEDTNKMFEEPMNVDFKVTEMNDTNHETIAREILNNV
jgi:adenylylsulfate kinase